MLQAPAQEKPIPKKNTVAKHNSMVVPSDLTFLEKRFAEHLCEIMPRGFVCTSLQPRFGTPDFPAGAARPCPIGVKPGMLTNSC